MRELILNTVASEIAPPEHAYENELTPDADPRGEVARAKALALQHSDLFEQAARTQHDLVEAMRAFYDAHPEARERNRRIKHLLGDLASRREQAPAYREASRAAEAAKRAYGEAARAVQDLMSAAAVGGPSAPSAEEREAAVARLGAAQAAHEQSARGLAQAREASTKDAAWAADRAEVLRLQGEVKAMLLADAGIKDLLDRSAELERRKRELTAERLKERGGTTNAS
jgi:hypothetical protein